MSQEAKILEAAQINRNLLHLFHRKQISWLQAIHGMRLLLPRDNGTLQQIQMRFDPLDPPGYLLEAIAEAKRWAPNLPPQEFLRQVHPEAIIPFA